MDSDLCTRGPSILEAAMTYEISMPGHLFARVDGMGRRLSQASEPCALLPELLGTAIDLAAADMGCIQLLDHGNGALRMVASRSLSDSFLSFFSSVSAHDNSACDAALITRTRIMVEDVTTNYLFVGTPALEVMLATGARAVHSTPAVNRSGRLMGVLSTHWRRPLPGMPYDPVPLDYLVVHLADRLEGFDNKSAVKGTATTPRRIT